MSTILAGTDTTAAADLAVDGAARLADERGAELLVLYVERGDARRAIDPARSADPGGHLARLASRYPGLTVRTRMEHGDPADKLVEVAAEVSADTIVVGNRGTQGSWWRVKDSVPNLVLRHAPCSVYIVDTRRAQ